VTIILDDVERWTLDGVTFGETDAAGCYWAVNAVSGWDSGPAPRSARSAKTAAHGSYRAPLYNNERVVTLGGWVSVPNEAAARSVRDQLAGLCTDPYTLYALRHTDQLSGEDAVAYVERDDQTLTEIVYGSRPLRVDFSLQLAAPDPRKYSATVYTAAVGMVSDAPGGIQWGGVAGSTGLEYGGPGIKWQGGSGSTGVLRAENPGTAEAPIQFAIAGPVNNPVIECTSTGDVLAYGGSVASGQTLQIDTETGAVLLDGSDRRPALTRADFFSIPAQGSLDIAFRADELSAATLVATWQHASW
jgi:hypothetical protein